MTDNCFSSSLNVFKNIVKSQEVLARKTGERWTKYIADLSQTAMQGLFSFSKDLHYRENKHDEMFEIRIFSKPHDILFCLTITQQHSVDNFT